MKTNNKEELELETKIQQAYEKCLANNPYIQYDSFLEGYYMGVIHDDEKIITLNQYLRLRHPTVNALTAAEAKILHINYPLESGWVHKYGSIRITESTLKKLNEAREHRHSQTARFKKKKSYKPVS